MEKGISKGALQMRKLITEAIDKQYITRLEYDTIISIPMEDNYVDRHEQAMLTQLSDLIYDKIVVIKKETKNQKPKTDGEIVIEVLKDIKRVSVLDPKPIPNMVLKYNEEFGEMASELNKLLGYTQKPYVREDLISEMADALQCLLTIYSKIDVESGISIIDDVFPEILVKNKKWEKCIPQYTINKNK